MYNEPSVRLKQAQQGLQPPLDILDASIRLEVDGVTDAVAKAQYGYDSTLSMAVDAMAAASGTVEALPRLKINWVTAYLHGVSFAVPVLLCAFSMYWLGYSLWGGDVPGEVASAIAAGTVSSFLVTGGIIQGMARRSLFYLTTGAPGAGAGTCIQWCQGGVALLLVTGLAGLGLNANFGWMPPQLAGLAVAFHASLGLLWLSCGVLYVLGRSAALGVVTLTGLAPVWFCSEVAGWPLVGAQVAGILSAALVATGIAVLVLRLRMGESKVVYPSNSVARTIYLAGPYFLYGVFYYLFLFLDRLLAWTAGTASLQLPLWFRGDYEVPLDIALVAFVLQVGWVHPSLLGFQDRVDGLRNRFNVARLEAFNRAVSSEYWRRSLLLVLWSMAVSLAVLGATVGFGVRRAPLTEALVFWALIGYLFLVFGLWNTSLLFSLSLPKPVLEAIGAAVVADLVVGYLLSRVFGYEAAVGGFVVGALVFALLSARGVRSRLQSADYFHYAAAV
ncbi:MAG: hypothetical protein JNN08_01675 [Bryobacterales bacterium]|nr:hypothetical protein [Bryobacterales bacterium]